jgi:small-conductance mechanosensitive channel
MNSSIYSSVVSTFRVSLEHAFAQAASFLPNLLSALLILAFGWLGAWLVARIVGQLLRTLGFDAFGERHGLSRTLNDVGLTAKPSSVVCGVVYWVVLLLALLPAVEALRLVYFTQLVAKGLSYIPEIIAAAVILLVGLSVARILSTALVRAARGANLEYAGALGLISRYFLSLIVIVITLAQLGVQTAILTIIFAVVLISAGVASAMALGLGSRAVVANLLAGAFVREHFPEGREIEVQGVRGHVVAVHSVGTVLKNESGIVTVPNTVLMENVVE